MKISLVVLFALMLTGTAFAQQTNDKEAIKKSINTLFEAMRKGDTILLKTVFDAKAVLHGVSVGKEDNVLLANDRLKGFIKAVGAPHPKVWDERITFSDIKVDNNLASVWAPYKFYLGTEFSHCGVDVFQLIKTKAGWKIIYLVDNTRKGNCPD